MVKLRTFRDGGLDFGALLDDGVLGDAVLLLDEGLGEAVFGVGVGFVGGDLDLGDEEPLDEGEGDADYGAERDDDLSGEIWEESGLNHLCGEKGRKIWWRRRV